MKKGFTLIELLIVFGIVAVIAVVVVVIINPAELLKQGRDVTRVSDMGTLNKAIALYYQDARDNPNRLFMGTSSVIYVSIPDPSATSTAGDQCQGLGLPSSTTGFTYQCAASSTYKRINGTGWVPINFSSSSAGSAISQLPVDPTNTTSTDLYYTYTTDGIGGFEVSAFFESQKDAIQMTKDNGNDPELYEKGSNLALASGRGLVGYWAMDEGKSSSTIDGSGNGNTGTWYGTATGTSGYYSPGKVGSWAGAFDGISTYMNPSSSISFSGTTPWTFSSWINWSGSTLTTVFYTGLQASYQAIAIKYGGGNAFAFRNETGVYTTWAASSSVPVMGTWGLVTWVADGSGNLSLYVNGALLQTKTGVDTVMTFKSIGSGYNNNYLYAGLIDDVRVYNRALSAVEIQEMYNAEK